MSNQAKSMTRTNPLLALRSFGQSVWLDSISRSLVNSGELARLVEHDGLRGVTSNPTIFENAIVHSRDYDASIRLLAEQGKQAGEIYEMLAVEDIQRAADLFRPFFDQTQGEDGFVSL